MESIGQLFLWSLAALVPVVVLGLVLWRVARRLTLPASLVLAHLTMVAGTLVPAFLGRGFVGSGFFVGLYRPFFLVYPGPLPALLHATLCGLVRPHTSGHSGHSPADLLYDLALPAVLTAVLGAIGWYLVGRLAIIWLQARRLVRERQDR